MQKQCHGLQLLVHDCLAKHLYGSAIFFADKLVSLSDCAPADVFTLAQVFTAVIKVYLEPALATRAERKRKHVSNLPMARRLSTWANSTDAL